jgi:hypothetical protein
VYGHLVDLEEKEDFMPSRDLVNNISSLTSIPPVLSTTSTTNAAIGVDDVNFESVTALFNTGAVSALCVVTLSLVECDTLAGTYTSVALTDIIGGAYPAPFTGVSNQVYEIGYVGAKRYVKAQIALSGTIGTGAEIGCIIVLSHARSSGGVMNTLHQ